MAKLLAAIQTVVPFSGSQLVAALADLDDAAPATLAAMCADELLALGEMLLVLDDFHLVANSAEVCEFVDALIAFPPPHLRVVLTSRSTPNLALDRLRALGRLLEIDPTDLAFTDDEAREFLRRVLTDEPASGFVNRVVRMAEGWPTMLHLTALVASHGVADVDEAHLVSAARRHAVAYLGVNLVDSLSSQQRAFLYRIALPERVSPALANVLTSDLALSRPTAHLLESVSAEGFFLIPLGEERAWFRFHSIFRAFLLERLLEEVAPDGVRSLHLRAAAWFEQQGRIDEAIDHALEAGDDGLASRIVIEHAQQAIAGDQWREFDRWLRLIPDSAFQSSIELVLIRGWLHQISGRYDLLASTIKAASEQLARDEARDAGHELYRAELELLRLHLHMPPLTSLADRLAVERMYGTLKGSGRYAELVAIHLLGEQLAIQDHDAAHAFLDGVISGNAELRDPFSRFRVLIARSALALLAGSEGNFHLIGDLGHQIIHGADEAGSLRMRAHGEVFAGGYHLEQRQFEEAESHLRRVAANACAGIIVRVSGVALLARCLAASGRDEEAQELVARHLDQFLETDIVRFLPVLRTCQAHLALMRDDIAEAARFMRQVMGNADPAIARGSVGTALLMAAILLAEERPEKTREADRMLVTLTEQPEYLQSRNLELKVLLLRAVVDRRLHNDTSARSRLRQALEIAEQGGYRWSLTDLGGPVLETLRWYRDIGDETQLLDTLLLESPSRPVSYQGAAIVEPIRLLPAHPAEPLYEELTFRELDVLAGLHRRLSNKEIAEELSISPLTVKSHTRSIYAKLGVNSRRQATARASSLGLVG